MGKMGVMYHPKNYPVRVNLMVDEETSQRLRERAEADRTNVSALIRKAVAEYLDR